MLTLSTDTAAAIAATQLDNPAWLVEIDADARDGGAVTTLRYGDRAITVDGEDYEPRVDLSRLRISQGAFRRRAGLASASQAQVVLYDFDDLSGTLASTYVLDNDTLRIYLAVGTPATKADLIPVITGTIRNQQIRDNRLILSLRDETDQLLPAFPQQLISPTQYPFAPTSAIGTVIPQPMGNLTGEGYYDLTGESYNLAPCRCIDLFDGEFLPGLYMSSGNAVYIERQGSMVQVDSGSITDTTGHAFRISGRDRKLRLRPAVLDTQTTTVTEFSSAADMDSSTHIALTQDDIWAFLPQSLRQQGDITLLRLGVHYKGNLTAGVSGAATVADTVLADHATADTDYVTIPHTDFDSSWDFIRLVCSLESPGDTELYAAWIEVDYTDWLEYEFAELNVYQSVEGFADDTAAYADGAVIVMDDMVLTNPIDQLAAVLRARSLGAIASARVSSTSQDAARDLRDGWDFAQSLDTQRSGDYIGELASEAMTHLWIDGEGKWNFTPMARTGTIRHAFRLEHDARLADPNAPSRLRVSQTPMDEILNDSTLAYALDVRTGQNARQQYRSYQHAHTGTAGAVSDGVFTDTAISDWSAVGSVGWNLWTLGIGQHLIVTAVSSSGLTVETIDGYDPVDESSIGEWYLGPELDPDSKRSELRYKRRTGFGRAREGFEQSTAWQLDWVFDDDAVTEIADLARDYYVDRLKLAQLTTWWFGAALERGDLVLLSGDTLGQHDTYGLGTADVMAASATLTFTLGVLGKSLKVDDWLNIGGEVVQVTALTDLAMGVTVTTDRGQFGTAALAVGSHTGLACALYQYAWQVQAIQIAPERMHWTYTLQQVPGWYRKRFNARASAGDFSSLTDDQKEVYRNLADDSGLTNPRDFENMAPAIA